MARSTLPPLPALRVFEAVARRASFKQAADELAVTPTAISHQIRQFETYLGRRVFDRTPRSVTMTPEGAALYEVTRSGLSAIAEVVARIQEGRGTARLTLSSTAAFLGHWLPSRLESLHRDLPAIDLRLHASDAVVDLRPGGIEAAIRYGKGPWPTRSYCATTPSRPSVIPPSKSRRWRTCDGRSSFTSMGDGDRSRHLIGNAGARRPKRARSTQPRASTFRIASSRSRRQSRVRGLRL